MSGAPASAAPWPVELRYVRARRMLEIDFDDGASVAISAETLRVKSPSAEVRGHGGKAPPPVTGKENVAVERMERVGNYAVRIVFDDGHATGLYTWAYLRELGTR
ncbi:MAG: gamma-butyrobetaine hydroxylase-like domain-containing protein [Micropepsaceae bacterium]